MTDEPDQERFMRLWTAAQPAVASYVQVLVRDHAAAKDVLQETALVIFRRFSEYDEDKPFVTWALGIARFKVMSMQRDSARSLVTFDDDLLQQFTRSWAELTPALSDRGALLQLCVERLARHARSIVKLRYYEGLKSEEIAKRTGTTAPAVRMALQRIREQLRACIERAGSLQGEHS